MKKVPRIDMSEFVDCESCVELCPSVFKKNKDTGLIEVADLSAYPEDGIEEAMSLCPADCIAWEEMA